MLGQEINSPILKFEGPLNFICLLKGQSQQILDHILGSLKLNQYFHKDRSMFLNFYCIVPVENSVKTAFMKKLSYFIILTESCIE
jgi:hypothetical protein